MDVLTAATYFKERPEWANAKDGHIGESMGGTTAMNLMRPYLRRAFNDLYGKPPAQLDAAVALYAGCTERNTAEAFLPIPLMFMHGEDDDDTLASDCQKQVPWTFWPASRLRCTLPLGAMARRKPGQMR